MYSILITSESTNSHQSRYRYFYSRTSVKKCLIISLQIYTTNRNEQLYIKDHLKTFVGHAGEFAYIRFSYYTGEHPKATRIELNHFYEVV